MPGLRRYAAIQCDCNGGYWVACYVDANSPAHAKRRVEAIYREKLDWDEVYLWIAGVVPLMSPHLVEPEPEVRQGYFREVMGLWGLVDLKPPTYGRKVVAKKSTKEKSQSQREEKQKPKASSQRKTSTKRKPVKKGRVLKWQSTKRLRRKLTK